jgi:hypothetical protein
MFFLFFGQLIRLPLPKFRDAFFLFLRKKIKELRSGRAAGSIVKKMFLINEKVQLIYENKQN